MASSLEITNGHAARMRWSRLKQQMEGSQPQAKKPRTTAPQVKKRKAAASGNQEQVQKPEERSAAEAPPSVKAEPGSSADPMIGVNVAIPTMTNVKPEQDPIVPSLPSSPRSLPGNVDSERMQWVPWIQSPYSLPVPPAQHGALQFAPGIAAPLPGILPVKPEPNVKVEPRGDQ